MPSNGLIATVKALTVALVVFVPSPVMTAAQVVHAQEDGAPGAPVDPGLPHPTTGANTVPNPAPSTAPVASAVPPAAAAPTEHPGPVWTRPAPPAPALDAAAAATPSDASALGGYDVLIADRGNNRLLLVNPQKATLWSYTFKDVPPGDGADDAFFTEDGKGVLTNLEEKHVIRKIDIATGKVTWEYGTLGKKGSAPGLLNYPDDAYPLPNGNIMVADIRNCRVIEIAPDKSIVRQAGITGKCWGPAPALASPNGDKPLPNGHVLVSTIHDHSIIELDSDWHEINRLQLPILYPSDPQETKAGNYLVAGYTRPGRLIEIARDGTIVWDYQPQQDGVLDHPSLAMELPNGNVLMNDDLNDRVVVIDKATSKILWQYGVTRVPGTRPGYLHIPDGLDIIWAAEEFQAAEK